MEESNQEPLIGLQVDTDAGRYLKETARWTKFIAIVCIIALLALLVTVILAENLFRDIAARWVPGMEAVAGILRFALVIMLLLAGFVVMLLYRFSTLTKKGIEMQNQAMFNNGLRSLKIYFIIQGIWAIITLISNISQLI